MRVICDSKRRAVVPSAKPGDTFDVQFSDAGAIILTRLEPADKPDHIRLIKKHGYTVARGTRKISREQIRRFQDEFP